MPEEPPRNDFQKTQTPPDTQPPEDNKEPGQKRSLG